MLKVHLDTDLGGDIDDLCALSYLLSRPQEIQITGITVVGDTDGKRTGYVRYVLGLAKRTDIPVAAGADTSGGYYPYELGLPPEERYWPEPVAPSPNPPELALKLLKNSIQLDATIIGIGPYTNLSLLEGQYPGILAQANLFLMGGFVFPPRPGYPNWGREADFNVQVDVKSALHVLLHSRPTLIPLSVTVETALRRTDLPAFRKSGPIGQLIARQAEAFALDEQFDLRYGSTCSGLPPDIINFQHDPLACAIAAGWRVGVEINDFPLEMVIQENGLLDMAISSKTDAHPVHLVTRVDGPKFDDHWQSQILRFPSS